MLALYCRPPILNLPQNSYGQFHILQCLQKYYETKIISFNSYDANSKKDIYFEPKNSKFIKILRFLFQKRATRLTHYWSDKFFTEYKRAIQEFDPDVLYIDNLLMMQYPFAHNHRAKIWFYDDESNLFIKENNLRKSWIEKFRNIGLNKFEVDSILISEKIFCITEEESQYLNSIGFTNVRALPYPIDNIYYYFNWSYPKENFSILFVGDFAHYPNREAAKIICREFYPALKSFGIKIVLVGRNFNKIQKYLEDGIITFENVADVRQFYWKNSVFVAPIFSGGGMRIKILEAAACGIPIIMTPLANLGINLKHLNEAVILNTSSEIIEFIKSCAVNRPNDLIKFSKNANQKINSIFSLSIMKDFYASLFSRH